MAYVYAYCNKQKSSTHPDFEFQPFYIGKGNGRRVNDHLRDARTGKSGRRLSHIRKLLLTDSLHIIIVKDNLTNEEAFALETELITFFGRKDLKTGCLLNATTGGDGARHSPETIKRIANTRRGRKWTPEHCKNISVSLTGRTRNPADGIKISQTLTGITHNEERRKNISIGVQAVIHKQRKKWLVVTPETSYCLVSLDYLKEAGIENLYRSFVTGKPLSRGRLKGWQLFQITEQSHEVLPPSTS